MLKKIISIALPILFSVLLLTSCSALFEHALSEMEPREIKEGFSDALVSILAEQYDLHIPESAVFIKGSVDPALMDSSLYLLFDVKADETAGMLGDLWSERSKVNIIEFPVQKAFRTEDTINDLFFSEEDEDGYICVCLSGKYPKHASRIK